MYISSWDRDLGLGTWDLANDPDTRRAFRLHRRRGALRPGLGHRGELAFVGEVEVDFPFRVAAVERELPVLGPKDVPVEAAVGIAQRGLVQDSLGGELSDRPRITAGAAVINAHR